MILLVGYRYIFTEDMSIKFMYSYDLEIGGALQGTGGAHEISLMLDFDDLRIFGVNERVYTRKGRYRSPEACSAF
jgi:hypothetical protein